MAGGPVRLPYTGAHEHRPESTSFSLAEQHGRGGRLIAAEQDRDRWHAEAAQDRGARHADAEMAKTSIEALRAELDAYKALPWWRRAFG